MALVISGASMAIARRTQAKFTRASFVADPRSVVPGKGARNSGREKRAAINHARVELDERGTLVHEPPGVRDTTDATGANDRDPALACARKETDDTKGFFQQRAPAQPALRLGSTRAAGALNGGIGGDNTVELRPDDNGKNVLKLFKTEVGRDLEQKRQTLDAQAVGALAVFALEGVEKMHKVPAPLQLAQPGRVGAADVDNDEVGVIRQQPEGMRVVEMRLLKRGDLRLADVDAQRERAAGLARRVGKPAGNRLGPGIGKAVAVDDRLVPGITKHARTRVAVLRMKREGANLGMPKTQRTQGGPAKGVLVKSRSKTDAVGELEPEKIHGVRVRGTLVPGLHEAHEPGEGGEETERANGLVVDGLRILPEKKGAEDFFVKNVHVRNVAKREKRQRRLNIHFARATRGAAQCENGLLPEVFLTFDAGTSAMNARVEHEAIFASAGSGKTYQLASRIVRLLACGAPPGSILALTFTRKAAGEFVRRTLVRIAGAASDEATARATARELDLPGTTWDAARFARLLDETVRELHRIQFGTLDSFFQRLARMAFAELGLAGAFTLLDERLAEAARERVLRHIFRRGGAGRDAQADFLAAFRLATWGRETRGVVALLSQFTSEATDLYHEFPGEQTWGGDATMALDRHWQPLPSATAKAAAVTTLENFLEDNDSGNTRTPAAALARFVDAVRQWDAAQPLESLGNFFEKTLLENSDAILSTAAARRGVEINYNRKNLALPADATAALALLLRHIAGGVLERCRQVTRGVHALLRQYDDTYERLVRRAGQFTFADTGRLLQTHLPNLAYRLDATLNHWLFDEFQDTSRADWRILEENLAEILGDASGARSAFFVGDVKQALYGWRGGDHTLLPDICKNHAIATRSLDTIWRSSPAVLDLVNTVFSGLEKAGLSLPEDTLSAWRGAWRPHTAAGAATTRDGVGTWHNCSKTGRLITSEENARRRLDATAALLDHVRPDERQLTCALLTQTNKEAQLAAHHLRQRGYIVTSETDTPVAQDNPVTRALLALLEFAAHPADRDAAAHLDATPALAAWQAKAGGAAAVRIRILEGIARNGFARTLQDVVNELAGTFPQDPFNTLRWEQLHAIARDFDATASRDVDEFVRYARRTRRRNASVAHTVQIMTIHKAKGLEFDVVLLPFLEDTPLASVRRTPFLANAAPAWVLGNPGKAICTHTPPALTGHYHAREAASCYETLCLLYVALTRAKRATHIFTTAMDEQSVKGANIPQLLARTLAQRQDDEGRAVLPLPEARLRWMSGNPGWHLPIPVRAPETAAPASPCAPAPPPPFTPRKYWQRILPSKASATPSAPAWGLPAQNPGPLHHGKIIHALLASLTYLNTGEPTANILAQHAIELRRHYRAGDIEAALAQLTTALRSPALQHALARPPTPGARLWRERAFSVILDGTWVSGVFDRVVFALAPNGGTTGIELHDFKTDADATPGTLLRRYATQLTLYRGALGKLTGVPMEKIHAWIVHIPSATLIRVPAQP